MDANIVAQYEEKLDKLFNCFLKPNYQIKNECYLNNLLGHLSGKDNAELGKKLLELPTVIEWVLKAITYWEEHKIPSLSISTFTLNLIALLSKDEDVFKYYITHDVYQRVFKLFQIHTMNLSPSTKFSYIKIISAFLEHKSGIEWVISNEIWKDILKFCLANQTVYIIREGQMFIFNLLTKSIDLNEDFPLIVIQEILSQFNESEYSQGNLFPEIEDEILQKNLRPTVNLIQFIFKNLFGDLYKAHDYRIANIFIANSLEESVNKILTLTRNSDFLYDLYNIIFDIYFFDIVIKNPSPEIPPNDAWDFIAKIGRVLYAVVNSGNISNMIKIIHLADSHWNYVMDRVSPHERTGGREPFVFQNQLLVFEMCPLLCMCLIHLNVNFNDIDEDDVRGVYIDSLFKMMCEETIRLAYAWRNILLTQVDAFDNAKLAVTYILKNIKKYDRQRGVKLFQSFIYTFKDLNLEILRRPTVSELLLKHVGFIVLFLEATATLITEFEISWRESVESISVMNLSMEFLKHSFWPPRVVIQTLKLVKLSVAKFLTPHLALLVEDKDETPMCNLGFLMLAKLYDPDWEVRDSALEVVHTVANISNNKYPAFQRMLIEKSIINLVVTMCTSDSEGFVRASAIKCLQEMIQVNNLWTEVLSNLELPEKMMHILQNETEAIVRTEAASLMRHIHEYQSFPPELMDDIYQAMAYAATSDLHWEVKSNALDFWGKVIRNYLHDQGFIDGKFPNVTFSKENRKIILLTEDVIKNKLIKMLKRLSEIGCLSVFVNAVQDDCDLEVAKKSLEKVKKLTRLLKKFDANLLDYKDSSVTEPAVIPKMPIQPPIPIDLSDEVIDEIINSQDISLLANCYTTEDVSNTNGIRKNSLKVVSPEMFINFIQKDLDSIIEEKTKWLNKMDNLSSLLDDMLGSYDNNVNTMDCY